MGAIYVDTKVNRATINYDECVECGACYRMSGEHLNPTLVRSVRRLAKLFRFRFEPEPDVCPTSAFVMEELEWPRIARRIQRPVGRAQVHRHSRAWHGRGENQRRLPPG